MPLKQKKLYQERKFLNADRSKRAYIIAGVTKEEWADSTGEVQHSVTATLEIADCSKTAYIEFDINDAKDVKRVRKKIDLLASVIAKFEQALLHAAADYPAPEPKKKRVRKTQKA